MLVLRLEFSDETAAAPSVIFEVVSAEETCRLGDNPEDESSESLYLSNASLSLAR